MLRPALKFVLVAAVLVPTLANFLNQAPLTGQFVAATPGDRELTSEWRLDKLPDPNATDHLIFETVYSLLQQWPNTRMGNGHNIVPGVIQKGTLLYHGRGDKRLPLGPEWVATDPEHSYHFCRGIDHDKRCWHLTLMTTRPLKVVYFDGRSAASVPFGPLDTQDLIAWGEVRPDRIFDDEKRITDLCNWGKGLGVDGFVRMEEDFEVILCNFASGVSVVSFLELTSRWALPPDLAALISLETVNAGSRHNHLPGETRVQLDLSRLVSFYDIQLVPSLVPIRAGQERWVHRVSNTSSKDILAVKSRLEKLLAAPPDPSGGIDWKTLIQVIVDRYAQHLELIRYLLHSSTVDPDSIVDLTKKTQYQLRAMLTPYLPFSIVPTNISDKDDLDWTAPIYKMCAMTHTQLMESEIDSMTTSEKLLLQAVRGTTREICRVVTKMWAAGVYAGVDPLLSTKESLALTEITQLWSALSDDMNQLMGWLDWNVWVKCDPACGFEEICYLHAWRVGFPFPDPPRWPGSDSPHLVDLDAGMAMGKVVKQAQVGPLKPKCTRRVYP